MATECTEECHIATGKKVKVWKVPRVAGETDQLIDSMCKGIQARAQAGQLAEGLADGEDIINYNGGGSGTRVSIVNCRGACMYCKYLQALDSTTNDLQLRLASNVTNILLVNALLQIYVFLLTLLQQGGHKKVWSKHYYVSMHIKIVELKDPCLRT